VNARTYNDEYEGKKEEKPKQKCLGLSAKLLKERKGKKKEQGP